MRKGFEEIFVNEKSILGMLHLGGEDTASRIKRAVKEFRILENAGFDGVIVENYFGPASSMRPVIEELRSFETSLRIGVNVLGDPQHSFDLTKEFGLDFIQIDSVSGHCTPAEDQAFAMALNEARQSVDALLLGGVRFKYQPVLSGRTEAEDVLIGKDRCDAIVITADRTGQKTDLSKVRRFRNIVGDDYPLIIGAGLTADNVAEQLAVADAGIVGSWLKEGHIDRGEMSPENTRVFMSAVRRAREAE